MYNLNQTEFEFNGKRMTATLWTKAAGRERVYLKRDGAEFGYFDITSGQFVKAAKKGFVWFGGFYSPSLEREDNALTAQFVALVKGMVVEATEEAPTQEAKPAAAEYTKTCLSCSCQFTIEYARRNGGDWLGNECGC